MTSAATPWYGLYPDGMPRMIEVPTTTLAQAWRGVVADDPERIAIAYFDGLLSAARVDELSDALAASFQARGVGRGDRVGIHLQNVPAFALALLALWKIGAAALLLNPMYRREELRAIVADSGAIGMLCAHADVGDIAAEVAGTDVRWLLGVRDADFQARFDPRVFDEARAEPVDGDLAAVLDEHRGRHPDPVDVEAGDLALLTYTSGTTGPAKGAMNTHGNVLAVIASYRAWLDLGPRDAVFAVAPFFHITGAVINASIALMTGAKLIMVGRFRPEVAIEALAEHRATFAIGSITAFNALYALPGASREHFASMRLLYSGGAPIPPTTVEKFRQRFGVYIHNVYGMTETTSAVIAVPPGAESPVDESSGTLSVGVPLPGVMASVVDEGGVPAAPGVQGELTISGPQVVPGYWRRQDATDATMPGGILRTGDGAIIDERGWVYLVDRLKDQINVSGYKVWPREVEDALYRHPAVHEAAVVGEPDDYSGERVVAYVSLVPGAEVAPEELVGHVRGLLAAYKVPREVRVVDDLPKTQTGKIRRNALRGDGPSSIL